MVFSFLFQLSHMIYKTHASIVFTHIYFLSGFYSFLLLNNIPWYWIYHSLFKPFTFEGHLCCLQFLAIKNEVAKSTHVLT